MVVIDRNNSKGLWAYKLIDNIDIKILEQGVKAGGGDYNHIYLIEHNEDMYIFGGKLGVTYKEYIGFSTNKGEVKNYNGNLFRLFKSDMDFNFGWEEIKDDIIENNIN